MKDSDQCGCGRASQYGRQRVKSWLSYSPLLLLSCGKLVHGFVAFSPAGVAWSSKECAYDSHLPCSGHNAARTSCSIVPQERTQRKRSSWSLNYEGGSYGHEEVEDFEFNLDVREIEGLTESITEVKQDGNVHSPTNIIFDCSSAEWLFMQVAYDRNIRLFSCSSSSNLRELSGFVPDDAVCCFTGVLRPKILKNLAKTKNLYSIVITNLEEARALEDAMVEERERLQDKKLGRVSKSREKFLEGGSGSDSGSTTALGNAPARKVLKSVRAFLRITDESNVTDVLALMDGIRDTTDSMEVIGLWGKDTCCHPIFQEVKKQTNRADLKLVLPFKKESSADWFKSMKGGDSSAIIWRFAYDLQYPNPDP